MFSYYLWAFRLLFQSITKLNMEDNEELFFLHLDAAVVSL